MLHFYNEFDPGAAEWLRELMKAGLIPEGEVDERDIREVRADDLRGFHAVHLFAGIGGWPYALRLAGWPDQRPVWTGSCPCQPYSAAGKGQGEADERDLWPAMFRLIRECSPDVCFGEQVEGAVKHGWLDRVSADLEAEGYAVGSCVLGAHSVGSPNIRQRLYWVADATGERQRGRESGQVAGKAGTIEGGKLATRGLAQAAADDRRARGLADSNGRESGNGHLQPGGQHGQRAQDGGTGGGMGDATSKRCEGDGAGRIGFASEPSGTELVACCSGSSCGVGNASSAGSQERGSNGGVQSGAGRTREGQAVELPGDMGFWSRYDFIPCRDGKARRVEPGSFPLVDGLPGRVGLLRGYGNAICPQTAAAFVRAWCEVSNV